MNQRSKFNSLNLKAVRRKHGGKYSWLTSLWMGENICQWSNRQGINFQNIQTSHAAEY